MNNAIVLAGTFTKDHWRCTIKINSESDWKYSCRWHIKICGSKSCFVCQLSLRWNFDAPLKQHALQCEVCRAYRYTNVSTHPHQIKFIDMSKYMYTEAKFHCTLISQNANFCRRRGGGGRGGGGGVRGGSGGAPFLTRDLATRLKGSIY